MPERLAEATVSYTVWHLHFVFGGGGGGGEHVRSFSMKN